MRVVKVGGCAQGASRLPALVAEAARSSRGSLATSESLCIVHGGGGAVSALQRRLGLEPTFRGGRRVTTAGDLEIVRMVLSGTTNKNLVSRLLSAGVRAVGISGEDGMLFSARAVEAEGLGLVGGAVTVDAGIVLHLLAGRFVPVISPLARDLNVDRTGNVALNVNGDDAAAALAAELQADELVFVGDVPGVLADGAVLRSLDIERASALIAGGIAMGGMAAKLEAAAHALHAGVTAVRITGIEGIGDADAGTRIILSHPPV
ncbi:MAG TPA: acetylglutamate kinase [Gemmatimonadaceae bacterium]|nr:acetylglutamate kinase [Gemmatimonadaceae bacterium]